jgi:putative DNA primase/helicase
LGPKNCTALTLTDLEHGFKPADLKNKLLSICGDVGSKKIINLELFKMLTGGDENMYDVKNKTPIRFTNYATLIFGANKMPQPIERCEAFYDRVMIVPLPRFFPKQPPELEDKLRRDLSSENAKSFILNKALEGLRRLHKNNGFTLPDMSKNVKREYMEEDDYVLEFLHENDISGLSSTEAYKKFEQWRYDKNYPCFMTEREFNKDVKNKGWELYKSSILLNGQHIPIRKWRVIL